MTEKGTPSPSVTARHLDPADAAFPEVVSDVLRSGHSVRFCAKGASMHPTIREAEPITVSPVRPADIRRGDVILYRVGRGVIAHRVAHATRRPDGTLVFLPRGDALWTSDEPVEESAVLGRVVAVERGHRTLDPAALRTRTLAGARRAASGLLRWLRTRLPGF